jgi:hypothetical protein
MVGAGSRRKEPAVQVQVKPDPRPKPKPHKLDIAVVYNGIKKKFKTELTELIGALRARVVAEFSVTEQPHTLSLYTADNRELTNDQQTVEDAGIKDGDTLVLRPGVIRGG